MTVEPLPDRIIGDARTPFLLLLGATLLVRSLAALYAIDPGFHAP